MLHRDLSTRAREPMLRELAFLGIRRWGKRLGFDSKLRCNAIWRALKDIRVSLGDIPGPCPGGVRMVGPGLDHGV